jgi:hypothetical protein
MVTDHHTCAHLASILKDCCVHIDKKHTWRRWRGGGGVHKDGALDSRLLTDGSIRRCCLINSTYARIFVLRVRFNHRIPCIVYGHPTHNQNVKAQPHATHLISPRSPRAFGYMRQNSSDQAKVVVLLDLPPNHSGKLTREHGVINTLQSSTENARPRLENLTFQ